MMGADNYDSPLNEKISLGVGANSNIQNTIIDKNARIGRDVYLNPEGLDEGWVDKKQNIYWKDGILVVIKDQDRIEGFLPSRRDVASRSSQGRVWRRSLQI